MRRKYLSGLGGAAVALIVAATLGTPAAQAGIIWTGDFETGNLSQYGTTQLPKKDSGAVVSSPRREGSKALKILMRRGDAPGRERAEVMPKAWSKYPKFKNEFKYGEEYWYAVSIYLPADWVIDNMPETVVQFHGRHDSGENSMQPPLALQVDGDRWSLVNRADGRRIIPPGAAKQKQKRWTLGKIRRGGWTDWVFRIKWSYKSDGLLQVWKDGEQVVSYKGMNTYNDARGPYLKVGIYKSGWKNKASLTKRRVLYFDALKIHQGPSSVKAMLPK